jgi:molybdate transport system substrate-binding protein
MDRLWQFKFRSSLTSISTSPSSSLSSIRIWFLIHSLKITLESLPADVMLPAKFEETQMKMRSLLFFGFTALFAQQAAAQGPLHVFCSNGMKAVLEDLLARAEREVGHPLGNIEFNTSAALKQRIQSGEAFDVAILSSDVLDDLIKGGKITALSSTELGRSGIGIGVRSGAPKPDIKTPEALKKSLLNAKSMTWVEAGSSRVHIDKMLEVLGIAKDVQSKIVLTQGVDQSIARVASGQTELVLTLISEIVPAKGLNLVGPLPAKVQGFVGLTGGISVNSKNGDAGMSLLKILASPSAAPTYHAKGMELIIVGDAGQPIPRK